MSLIPILVAQVVEYLCSSAVEAQNSVLGILFLCGSRDIMLDIEKYKFLVLGIKSLILLGIINKGPKKVKHFLEIFMETVINFYGNGILFSTNLVMEKLAARKNAPHPSKLLN